MKPQNNTPSTAKPGRPSSKPERRSFNIRMHAGLIVALDDYCSKNSHAGSASDVLELATFRFLRTKVRKYQLVIPPELLSP